MEILRQLFMLSKVSSHEIFPPSSKFNNQYFMMHSACKMHTHYDNMPMQYTVIFHGCKNGKFSDKNRESVLIFAPNIDRGYTLEPRLTEAVLTCTHDLCCGAKIRKKLYTPINPSFTI